MPDADWHALRDGELQPLDHAEPLVLAPALHETLAKAAAGETVFASDEGDAAWRLRKVVGSDALWRVQAVADSRSRIFTRLRCLLSSRLSSQFLHDLRNPTNALSLHTDLLARLVTMPDAAERSAVSLRVIRERLTELTRRQSALVSLWLATPAAETDTSTQGIMENAVRVVRGFGALHEIHLRADEVDALNACAGLRAPVHVEVAFIGLLMLAYQCALAAKPKAPHELALAFSLTADHRVSLKIPVSIDEDAPVAGFEWDGRTATGGAIIRDLMMLLDDEPLNLGFDTQAIELLLQLAR